MFGFSARTEWSESCYLRSVLDMEDGHFELQPLERAVGANVGEGFGELLRRCVRGESLYCVGSGGAESHSYRIKVVRIPSQHSDGKIAMRWV